MRNMPAEGEAGGKVWNVAVYIRLSRDDGNEESLSVSNQRKILLEYLEHSFQGEWNLMDIYTDDGQSGTDHERPGFQRMLCDVERGSVNCILCKNLSRAFRNYSDQGYFLESFFPRYRVRFITLGDPKVDTFLNPETVSGMEIPISGLMNDRFAYKTSSDIRRTFDTKRRRGEFIGAFAPYGYRKDPENKNRLIPDPEAAEVVETIFDWYVYGDGSAKSSLSKAEIARKLNGLGIPNPSAYKRRKGMKYYNPQGAANDGLWQGSTVAAVLSNEMYVGTMVQGKQRVVSYKVHDRAAVAEEEWYKVPNTHEPIVERELFELARKLQAEDLRRVPGTGQNHLFSGLLKCADCKKAMTRKSSKGIQYFNCSTYRRKSRTKCSIHSIRQDALEEAVLQAVRRQIASIANLPDLLREIRTAPASEKRQGRRAALLKSHREELNKMESLMDELYLDWKSGDLAQAQYRHLKEKLEGRTEHLKTIIRNLQEESSGEEDAFPHTEKTAAGTERIQESRFEHSYVEEFLESGNLPFLSRGILTELIEEILVQENGAITVVFRFSEPDLSSGGA